MMLVHYKPLEREARCRDFYEAVFEKAQAEGTSFCDDCQFNHRTVDREPYGDRYVPRVTVECGNARLLECPAVEDAFYDNAFEVGVYLVTKVEQYDDMLEQIDKFADTLADVADAPWRVALLYDPTAVPLGFVAALDGQTHDAYLMVRRDYDVDYLLQWKTPRQMIDHIETKKAEAEDELGWFLAKYPHPFNRT